MMWLWDSPLLTFFTIVAIAAFCFWYYLLKPFLRGQLSPPLGRAIGRLVHYPKLPFIMGTFYFGLRPCPYWTPIDDFVYLGGLPLAWHEDELKKHKIKAVVNMCDEDCGPITLYLKLVSIYSTSNINIITSDQYKGNRTTLVAYRRSHRAKYVISVPISSFLTSITNSFGFNQECN